MVNVSPDELRRFADNLETFAGMLEPSSFSRIGKDLGELSLLGSMPEAEEPHRFIQQWAPPMVDFAEDLLRGIEAFRTAARDAANRFETTDIGNAEQLKTAMAEAVNAVHGDGRSADLSGLPQPPPAPPPPPPPPEPSDPLRDIPFYAHPVSTMVPALLTQIKEYGRGNSDG